MDELREELAAEQHRIWAHWMEHLFSVSDQDVIGEVHIPADCVARWQRQIKTDYADLSLAEKADAREQANKILDVLKQAERKA